ncbi:hypothetical protein [Ruegeria sp. HKCCD8929]|uniref:hypothetical protein n=1 Tax=Ruegeria sp. HKCCD8929 TaxID=2683006 RepID=UPI001489F615|nr:hypothetical protein [Ruegeria sp. HKCCD8929]
MRDKKLLTLRKYSQFSAMILATATFLAAGKDAAALTADDVLNNMSNDQGISYVNGVVEGLATARWLADRPEPSGMQCIYEWYYQTPIEPVWNSVVQWLERHPDQQVGILMQVLINRECGE